MTDKRIPNKILNWEVYGEIRMRLSYRISDGWGEKMHDGKRMPDKETGDIAMG